MHDDHLGELAKVFEHYLELTGPKQGPFVDRLKKANPEIQQAICEMIRRSELTENIVEAVRAIEKEGEQSLEVPFSGQIDELRALSQHLFSDGRYRLLEMIGMGGMGEVYAAEQAFPVKRQVAIKLLKKGSRSVSSQLEKEGQVLALLNNNYIAKVFEVGKTSEGFPFISMEYIQGTTLLDYCRVNDLSLRDRTTLFLQACLGVAHAHHKGLLHGDLKPNNIMISLDEAEPTVKIIDFGIAQPFSPQAIQVLGKSKAGRYGSWFYMAPETVEGGETDTRSDIFCLGLILYELWTGARFHGGENQLSRQQMIDRVKQGAPQERKDFFHMLQQRTISIRGKRGLAHILFQMLQKEPDRRYATVDQVRDDLLAFHAGDTVTAVPQSTWYELTTFILKHRALSLVGSLLIFVLIMASLLVYSSRQKAIYSLSKVEKTQVFYKELLNKAHPYRRGPSLTVMELLEAAQEDIPSYAGTDTDLEYQMREVLGDLFFGMEQFGKAEVEYRQILGIGGEETDLVSRAENLDKLARALRSQGKMDEATACFTKALDILEREVGNEHPDYSRSMIGLASVHFASRRFAQALDKVNPARERLLSSLGLGHTYTQIAVSLTANIYLEKREYERAIDFLEPLVAQEKQSLGPNHPRTLVTMVNLGKARLLSKQYHKALIAYKHVSIARRSIFGENHRATARSLHGEALCLKGLFRYKEASNKAMNALLGLKKGGGMASTLYLSVERTQANILLELNDVSGAIDIYRRQLDLFQEQGGHESKVPLQLMGNLGVALLRDGRTDEAVVVLGETLAAKRCKDPESRTVRYTMLSLVEALLEARRFDEALDMVWQVMSPRMDKAENTALEALWLAHLGACYYCLGQAEESRFFFEESSALPCSDPLIRREMERLEARFSGPVE